MGMDFDSRKFLQFKSFEYSVENSSYSDADGRNL